MTTLLIATRNRHKVQEIQALLGDGFRCLTLDDFPGAPAIDETATTFAGNATLKSEGLAKWLCDGGVAAGNLPAFVLADDSGLEVDALGGAPGVYSARFAAQLTGKSGNSPDSENNARLLRELDSIPDDRRTARFRCVIALTSTVPPKFTEIFQGACEGRIERAPKGAGGFGYDPLFIPTRHHQSFAELGEVVKNGISHRANAMAGVVRRFRK
ncbi:MAG TPA: non-canonical purine NTP pyrophosphatase [Roseimicrobium sp.]|nr:non-canonical purine NTP pyrophosphatase [Roseimicrobium sp.]